MDQIRLSVIWYQEEKKGEETGYATIERGKCVCVCVCERERERGGKIKYNWRERERERERESVCVCVCHVFYRLHKVNIKTNVIHKYFTPKSHCIISNINFDCGIQFAQLVKSLMVE